MVDRAGIELAFNTVIHAEAVDLRHAVITEAGQHIVVGGGIEDRLAISVRIGPAARIGSGLVLVEVAVTGVLADLPAIVEFMADFVTHHRLVDAAIIDIRLTIKGLAIELAEGRVHDRADIGQEAVADMDLIERREIAVERSACLRIRLEGDLRHDEAAQILGIVGVIVAAGDLAGDAVFPHALLIDLVAEIEAEEGIAEIIDADFRFPHRLILRALADHLHDAAGIGAAVKHRGGAFQDLHALQTVGIHLETAETVAEQVQPIEEHAGLGGLKTANINPVRVRVRAEGFRRHTRGVT
ncbi:hypothetical protein D3C86_1345760 [compost metagenome]